MHLIFQSLVNPELHIPRDCDFNFLEDGSPFCVATDTPCFGLLVTSALGLKPGWIPRLRALLPAICDITLYIALHILQVTRCPRNPHLCSGGQMHSFYTIRTTDWWCQSEPMRTEVLVGLLLL